MTEAIAKAMERIIAIRLGLMPPYCYDQIDDEPDADALLAYYQDAGPRVLSAIDQYHRQLDAFAKSAAAPRSADGLLSARREFIATTPFARDELDSASAEQAANFRAHMLQAYQHIATTPYLRDLLIEYRRLVVEVTNPSSLEVE